jgi:ATP-dependent protease ClpP protease subunit
VRRIGPSTMFLVHEAQFKAGGSFGDVKDTIELIEHLHTRLLTILAARSTMTVDDIKVKWERKDWWMPAQTAVDLGFADIII